MASPTTAPSEAEQIQRQMRDVRAELRDDVTDLVKSAHKMSDWASYVRAYPWVCVGAAAAAGYFLVPTRPLVIHPDPESLFKLAKQHDLVMKPDDQKPAKKKGGLVAQLVSMAAAAALNGGLRIASQQFTQAMSGAGQARSNGRAGVHHA
jgi:hypothetical protein